MVPYLQYTYLGFKSIKESNLKYYIKNKYL